MIIMNPAIIIFFGALEIKHVEVFVIGTLKKNCGEHGIFFVFGRKLKRKRGDNGIFLSDWNFEEYFLKNMEYLLLFHTCY